MHNRLVVSTTCPTCSAPLDFDEGAHAVRCRHCRSNLLVTGHKQVLSYAIPPTLELKRAVARVLLAHKEQGTPCRVRKLRCYFIPYYRLTGHDFRWEKGVPVAQSWPFDLSATGKSSLLRAFGEPTLQFRDRYVEKSFLACQVPETRISSLGIRPSVLRLELFQQETLMELGAIVPVDMAPSEALTRGLDTVEMQPLFYRQVLNRRLSVIYFPYWVVEVERQAETMLTIVDAVSHKVVRLDAPLALYAALDRRPTTAPGTISFRPLVCPNCGWDLPLRPEDVTFFCTSCERAWQIYGSDLRPITYETAGTPAATRPDPVHYLPFWVLQVREGGETPRCFFLPAFRYRRLKVLAELARRLSRQQPHYLLSHQTCLAEHGCHYDQDDAARLAYFTHVGLTTRHLRGQEAASPPCLSFISAALTWFPFTRQGTSLLDPFTKMSLRHEGLL